MPSCRGCHEEKEIYVKKSMLCKSCYKKRQRVTGGDRDEKNRETFLSNHPDPDSLVRNPVTITLEDGNATLAMDFYDLKTDTYYHPTAMDNKNEWKKVEKVKELYPRMGNRIEVSLIPLPEAKLNNRESDSEPSKGKSSRTWKGRTGLWTDSPKYDKYNKWMDENVNIGESIFERVDRLRDDPTYSQYTDPVLAEKEKAEKRKRLGIDK